jgi:hypothetical protein
MLRLFDEASNANAEQFAAQQAQPARRHGLVCPLWVVRERGVFEVEFVDVGRELGARNVSAAQN